MDFKYAIFDLDGTLIDSMKIWRTAAINAVETVYGIKFTKQERDSYLYFPFNQQMTKIINEKNLKLDIDHIKKLSENSINDMYINGKFKIKPYVREFLTYLRDNGVKCAISTATPKSSCIPYLEKTGLIEFFDYVFTTPDDAFVGKHEGPRVFDMSLEALKGTKENTVVFEDNLVCIKTCKNNGYRVISVSDILQETTIDEIKKLSDKHIETFKELIE